MLRVPLFSLIAARSLSAGHLSSGSFCSKFSSCQLALHPSKFSQRAQIPLFKFCSRSLSGILHISRELNTINDEHGNEIHGICHLPFEKVFLSKNYFFISFSLLVLETYFNSCQIFSWMDGWMRTSVLGLMFVQAMHDHELKLHSQTSNARTNVLENVKLRF